ncbi:hypothetical protein TNCT_592101 [Trichonephila clavata]|uniref:Uncharacterized protein n=1 Tax=Trichonephila clavata TaxID=2740835 RepID=A0A8X6FBL0_TRICU|nr:hypothetical protein TNCT_592101 [Trichonephila clavata]
MQSDQVYVARKVSRVIPERLQPAHRLLRGEKCKKETAAENKKRPIGNGRYQYLRASISEKSMSKIFRTSVMPPPPVTNQLD